MKYFLLLVFSTISFQSFSQYDQSIHNLGLILPPNPQFDKDLNGVFHNRMMTSINMFSASESDQTNPVNLRSTASILDHQVSGSSPMFHTVKIEVQHSIVGKPQLTFHSMSNTISDVGNTKKEAIRNAIVNYSVDKVQFESFLKEGDLRIRKYLEQNSDRVLAQAEALPFSKLSASERLTILSELKMLYKYDIKRGKVSQLLKSLYELRSETYCNQYKQQLFTRILLYEKEAFQRMVQNNHLNCDLTEVLSLMDNAVQEEKLSRKKATEFKQQLELEKVRARKEAHIRESNDNTIERLDLILLLIGAKL